MAGSGRTWERRAFLCGAGVAGLAGAGTVLYRQAPSFWRQYFKEWGREVVPPPHRPDPKRWPDTGLHGAWLGHSTVLLRMDGFTILTDPVFSERAGLNLGPLTLGVKRRVKAALNLEDLPPVDLVLVSHAHMDHLDIPSLRRLESKKREVVMARSTSDLIRPERYAKVTELGWGERARVKGITVRALEVNHWGARMRTDTWRGYNGYLIEAGRYRVLFAGDTAVTDAFHEVRGTGRVDFAVMPIGAYNPWIRYHCTPEQAWRMGNDARAELFVPVHHQTFDLSREPYHEPIERFVAAAGSRPERVLVRAIGEEFRLA